MKIHNTTMFLLLIAYLNNYMEKYKTNIKKTDTLRLMLRCNTKYICTLRLWQIGWFGGTVGKQIKNNNLHCHTQFFMFCNIYILFIF